ncbi:hypothetical protein MKC48_03100 [[Clostridium] innocuum]|nr:hypothetical protein [[Clostridium] innocuum]
MKKIVRLLSVDAYPARSVALHLHNTLIAIPFLTYLYTKGRYCFCVYDALSLHIDKSKAAFLPYPQAVRLFMLPFIKTALPNNCILSHYPEKNVDVTPYRSAV